MERPTVPAKPKSHQVDGAERRSDPKLRALTEMILAMSIDDRIRQIEAEANFFASVRRVDDDVTDES